MKEVACLTKSTVHSGLAEAEDARPGNNLINHYNRENFISLVNSKHEIPFSFKAAVPASEQHEKPRRRVNNMTNKPFLG